MPLAELREGETVAAQGSVRSVHERRFRGHFTQADKLDRVQRSVARYANRLVDIQVVDSESLPSSRTANIRRAS